MQISETKCNGIDPFFCSCDAILRLIYKFCCTSLHSDDKRMILILK